MEIEITEDRALLLKKVYNGVKLESDDKETISICMRDSGFEFNYNGVTYEAKRGKVNKLKSSNKETEDDIPQSCG